MKPALLIFVLLGPLLAAAAIADTGTAVTAINTLGLDLYRTQPAGGNLLLSPYSIQNALAMTYAGADGETRAEMQRVLHYPTDENALDAGFAELGRDLAQIAQDSAQEGEVLKGEDGKPGTPIEFHLANRLFVQRGYEFRAPFLALLKDKYGAPPEQLDFFHASEEARETINRWAEDSTKGEIRDVIPTGAIAGKTRLILANAVYLRAPWPEPFKSNETKPESFFIHPEASVPVPTMQQHTSLGYEHHRGFVSLALPYKGGGLQFLILLPDAADGLPALERKITPALLAEEAKLPSCDVILHLPKFQLAPPSMPLGDQLRQFGLKTAFDEPRGSANFDRMAPRKPDDYLYIGEVYHKAFLKLDEEGTEATAVTEITIPSSFLVEQQPKPIEVRVNHPFLFAIQHVSSGACLFLGRVTDPR